jgi:hypothetical protein
LNAVKDDETFMVTTNTLFGTEIEALELLSKDFGLVWCSAMAMEVHDSYRVISIGVASSSRRSLQGMRRSLGVTDVDVELVFVATTGGKRTLDGKPVKRMDNGEQSVTEVTELLLTIEKKVMDEGVRREVYVESEQRLSNVGSTLDVKRQYQNLRT